MREPYLPSTPVQTARDTASEVLKSTDLKKKIERRSLTVRYDNRMFKFYPDSHAISLTTDQQKAPSIRDGQLTIENTCKNIKMI
ncbi:hypothetical protein [Thermoplasma sp. Kam2015]|uniref:hypothetical protein n=1 Tax=Thermoplasma sp. Kam2015 TaxID=2094122 RepID=UPI001F3A705C|nr:hypothetical protein [Thermoplasma sp. Kam2015]